ncbi:uncharacterized protein [Epargyreus clarus]|uniref:uncharacterized protein n=1 Tax=Epargyreus clarus TaxID=520877 RepID=UPI003C2AED1A
MTDIIMTCGCILCQFKKLIIIFYKKEMPPKDAKKPQKASTVESVCDEYEDIITPRSICLSLILEGNTGPGEWNFLIVFNGQVILDTKWHSGNTFVINTLPINLKEPYYQALVTNQPLIFLLRSSGGKSAREPDPLLNPDNKAGGNVDLFPLVIGEEKIFLKLPLIYLSSGQTTECIVIVRAYSPGVCDSYKIPLMLTMISAHCLPYAREGTVYLSAIGLNGVHEPMAVNFGMSLSTPMATKLIWASASNGGQATLSGFNVPSEDMFIEPNLETLNTDQCISVFWNAFTRVLVDPIVLRERLSSPFLIELAGVPRIGKIDVRGRYMAFVDASVLLEPGQYGVTTCAKLMFYNEADLPEQVGGLLDLPPTSAKITIRESDFVVDENGHQAYVVIRFDLFDPLVPKAKMTNLFETLGFPVPDGPVAPVDELSMNPLPEDPTIDVRKIRKEYGALCIHKELSNLACKGTLQMTQSIKRTAANRLLTRVRTMLKQFAPGECSYLDWQDLVAGQHASCRRAVAASFAPQPPPLRPSQRSVASRNRQAGDVRIANEHMKNDMIALRGHPYILLSKVLRCLEEGDEFEARRYLLEALSAQIRNRYLLWVFGGLEFDKEKKASEKAAAALRIAVKGDTSDGTTCAIGWAALHALHHYNENTCAAFVAAKKMRKSYELPKDWRKYLQRWIDTSGQEEVFWIPGIINSENPILIASAFFLCLRCYKFSERLLKCVEEGCASRGSRRHITSELNSDVFYLRAASFILKRNLDLATETVNEGIRKFGPSALMSQMRAICLVYSRGWDGECDTALLEADKAGAEPCPALLLRAALGGLKTNPEISLQRAARAHQVAPSAHSALILSRIYAKLGKEELAVRWATVSVNTEPLLADGWAFLSILAMREKNIDKARAMLRTAKQVGPISAAIEDELKKIMHVVHIEELPDSLVNNLCFCDYY